ncbi:MAG TPA: universal stress protein [Syntrophales bacterium]|nr:universal stress protein [Syntrophales bacterium]
MIKNILIPLDGSSVAESKIPEVIKMFKISGQDLNITLFHAIELMYLLPRDKEAEYRMLKERSSEFLDEIKKKIEKEGGIRVDVVVKAGKPSVEICNYAERNEIDMVVMASHGYGMVASYALGSATDGVTRHCTKPVLILRV